MECNQFIPLDYEVLHDKSQMDTAELRGAIAAVGAHRPVVPVVWAHHDDGNYVGRPYTPYAEFAGKLDEAKAAGFGIIHWTTRPLDLYFASLSEQVWQETENRPLRVTCEEMGERSFGAANRRTMGEYLFRWVTEAPKIGRETSDFFIDRKLGDVEEVAAGSEGRAALLEQALGKTTDPAVAERIRYFQGLERYLVDVHRTEAALSRAKAALKAGDLAAARRAMEPCRPEEVIERYAEVSQLGGITRGEQGLIVSMNLRWLTHHIRFRQVLGLEPVRHSFAATSHDPLAQSMGTFTFHFGPDRSVWQCLGTRETGGSTFRVADDVEIPTPAGAGPAEVEICRTGVESDGPLTIPLRPIMAQDGRGRDQPGTVPPGRYRLCLLMLDPTATAAGQRVFDVSVSGSDRKERVDVFERVGAGNRVLKICYPLEIGATGAPEVKITPVEGRALICGVTLEPVVD